MKHKAVFKKAWELATLKQYKRLLWYGFIPALFTTTVTTFAYSFRGYQYWIEGWERGNILEFILWIITEYFRFVTTNPGLGIISLLGITILVLAYMMLPLIFQGGLMQLIPMVLEGKPIQYRMGVVYGSKTFFKLFEFKSLFSPFRVAWISLTIWILNTISPASLNLFAGPIALWFLVAVAMNVACIFSEYFIVLKGSGVMRSIPQSTRLVFLHLEEVLYILFLMFLVGLRVIVNVVITFAIPLGIIIAGGYFASSMIESYVMPLAILVGGALLIFMSYINGIVSVFVTAAWTLLFRDYTDGIAVTEEEARPEQIWEESDEE